MAMALSRDEKFLAAASGPAKKGQSPPENKIVVWRYAGGIVKQISVKEGWQYALAFSPDNRYIVSGGSGKDSDWHGVKQGSDKSIRVWEIKTGKEIRKFTGHGAAVRCLAFTPNGDYLVSGSEDSTVRIWPFRE
jgi:WD40 repeat protein